MSELKAIDRSHRNPEKFDVIDLYDAIGRDKGYRLGNPEDEAEFSALVTEALSSAQSPTMVHGRRVEAMFSYITASLGKSLLIKKEDCGLNGKIRHFPQIIKIMTTSIPGASESK